MSPPGTIVADHIWKRFRADRRRSRLRDELDRARARMRGESDRSWRWALRDVGFSTEPGESVGLVGVNGSGKSTLLKILSRVMYPYAGSLEVSGRVGALIEVSSGIHPELTGRENAYLFGSLLGLPRQRVADRFDEIVDFAEVGGAIDRQVKFYSSGMKMRLGFAVAAFLEPDVLLVDEVLAVGDASFQQRCLDRMRVVLAQGTTLVFVSHDLAAVEATCARGLWIQNGTLQIDGTVAEALGAYRRFIEESVQSPPTTGGPVRLVKLEVSGEQGRPVRTQGPLEVRVVVEADKSRSCNLHLGVSEGPATPIFLVRRDLSLQASQEGEIRCSIARLPLPRGRFYLWIGVFEKGKDVLPWHPAAHFDVEGPFLDKAPQAIVRLAPVHVETTWELDA